MKDELNILFNAICDGVRQEVRQRKLVSLVTRKDFSLCNEREQGVAASLAFHLRQGGFWTQVESYFASGSMMRRPDFRIWLPASKKFIYLELKQFAWGNIDQYSFPLVLDEIEKLNAQTDPENLPNGLIALGFSRPDQPDDKFLQECKNKFKPITAKFPYDEIGLNVVELQAMDTHSGNAVVGFWVSKTPCEPSEAIPLSPPLVSGIQGDK